MLPSDRQLVDAARTGHEAAWAELMSRHEASIRAVLPKRSKQRSVARALAALRDDLHDESSVGDESVRAFRPRAFASYTKGAYGPVALGAVVPGEPDPGDDRQLLARAFGRLPEPWQTVLWHTYVEQLSAAEVSPLVGRTVNEVGELIATAERGLTDAFLQEYIESSPLDPAAATMVAMLGGFVRESLPPHQHRLVEDHLAQLPSPSVGDDGAEAEFRHTSDDSRRLIAVASSLPTLLPPAIAPGITGLSVEQLRAALGTTTRSFGTEKMVETQASRFSRAVVIGSAAAVVLVLLGVALLVRQANSAPDGATASVTSASPSTSPETAPSTSPTTDPGDQTEPTTTLDLRPSGPPNEILLVVNPGARAEQLAGGETTLITEVSAAAPVFAGGTGTLDIALSNESDEPVAANLEMMLPQGIVFDRLVDGDAACENPDDNSPFCDIVVAPDTSLDLSVQLSLEAAVVGRLVVDGDTLDVPFEAQIVAVRHLVHNSVGHGDVLVIGNTVMSCSVATDDSCNDVRAGTSDIVNRWDVSMEFVGADSAAGLANSSGAVLALPETAAVAEAHLLWSGDLREGGRAVPSDGQSTATLITPAGDVVEVEAEDIIFGEEDSTQYIGRVDVTDVVAAGGAGQYVVGNIASVEADGSYGGWTLVVVTDDDALPRRQRVVLEPFEWVAPQDPFMYGVDLPTAVLTGANAHLGVVAFEGERGFQPELLTVNGASIGGDNPFDSTIVGDRSPAFDNNLGVDIDAYDLSIDTPAGTLSIDATSADDGIRLAVLGITIDLAP